MAEPDLGGSGFGRIPLQIRIYSSYLSFFFLMKVTPCDREAGIIRAWKAERSCHKLEGALFLRKQGISLGCRDAIFEKVISS